MRFVQLRVSRRIGSALAVALLLTATALVAQPLPAGAASLPPAPGGVSSGEYPSDGQFHGGAGIAGTFTISPPAIGAEEIAGYAYTLDSGVHPSAATQVTADPAGHGATVTVTPASSGSKTLRVWSRSAAGSYSLNSISYSFLVRSGAGPAAAWNFDEAAGAGVTDASGHGNTATVTGGAWTPDRRGLGSALLLAGEGAATTAGPLATTDPETGAPATTRTDRNLTVSAWARLDEPGGAVQAVVSQDGARTSAFSLEYSGADDRWRFAVAGADADGAVEYRASSNAAPRVGAWTYLIGTYDLATRAVRLYVDGVEQTATATVTGGFAASGPVAIGRRESNGAATGWFTGAIDEVRVYPRLLGSSEREFLHPLDPTRPIITFPDGNTVEAGQGLRITIDALGDQTATRVVYGLGASLNSTADLPVPGGQVTVTVTPRFSGRQYVMAAAVSEAGNRSETVAGIISVTEPPVVDPPPDEEE